MDIISQGDILCISGVVTVNTLTAPLYRQFIEQSSRVKQIDLGGVEQADSACVSLLLAAKRLAPNIEFINIPATVLALADLYEIKSWITHE